jgi:hypothetical protein
MSMSTGNTPDRPRRRAAHRDGGTAVRWPASPGGGTLDGRLSDEEFAELGRIEGIVHEALERQEQRHARRARRDQAGK